MKILGISFALLNGSLDKRLQTLAAAIWTFLIVSGFVILPMMAYLLIYKQIRYLVLPYFLWIFYNRNTYKRSGESLSIWTKFLRNNAFVRYFCNFPVRLVKTVDLDSTKSYLFVCIPHGIMATGITAVFGTDILNCRKLFPGLDISCYSSSAESIRYLLSTPARSPFTGRTTLLAVGGAAELFETKPCIYCTAVKKRKSFIKLALQHGTTLVPVFSFGETDLYNQLDYPEGILRRFKRYIFGDRKIFPVIYWGRGFFQYSYGVIPKRKPITVVVGNPIELPKIAEPTAKQIIEYREKYIQHLVELFETHKHSYLKDPEKTVLELL